jgi:hypothetical protein
LKVEKNPASSSDGHPEQFDASHYFQRMLQQDPVSLLSSAYQQAAGLSTD